MKWRIASVIMLAATIAGIVLIQATLTYHWYTGVVTLRTQEEYTEFVDTMYSSNVAYRIANIQVAENTFVDYDDAPPEGQPVLPVVYRYLVKVKNAIPYPDGGRGEDESKFVWSIVIGMVGGAGSVGLWIAPKGLYEKRVLVAKEDRKRR